MIIGLLFLENNKFVICHYNYLFYIIILCSKILTIWAREKLFIIALIVSLTTN